MACNIWYTKRQATIKSAFLGGEFVAMKQAMVVSRGLRYKFRMMGVSIQVPTHLYRDNMSTIHNTQCPESQLKKKSNSICYHAVREMVEIGELLTGYVKRILLTYSTRLWVEGSRGRIWCKCTYMIYMMVGN